MRRPNITSRIDLKVEAIVNPSEDTQKVIDAIANLFTRCSPEVSFRSRVVGRAVGSDSLAILYEQVRSRSAMGVLRRMLLDNRVGDSTSFLLNKQAATSGIASSDRGGAGISTWSNQSYDKLRRTRCPCRLAGA